VHHIKLTCHLLEAARYDRIVQCQCPYFSNCFVGDAQLSKRQSRMNLNAGRQWLMEYSWKNGYISAGDGQGIHQLPSGVADSIRT
jgi:hypothetical protein